MVTTRNAHFNFGSYVFLSTFTCLLLLLTTNNNVSPNKINGLVFVAETWLMLCEVKYEFLHTEYTNFSLQIRPNLQLLASYNVSKRLVFDSWASPRE